MLDLGWSELLVIGIVALIVVGPKDLPMLFRNVGRFMGKARGMAREFTRAMNDAADESGVRDVAKTFKTATNPMGSAMDGVKDAARAMTDPTPDKKEGLKEDPNALDPEREQDRAGKVEQHAPRIAAFREDCRAPARLGHAMQRQKNAAEQPARARVVACIQ